MRVYIMKGDLTRSAIVYIVTNKLNGKRYVGITTQPLRRRLIEHFCHAKKNKNNGAFYRAIRKYGQGAFTAEIVLRCKTCIIATEEEIRLIKELKPEYNSTLGGDGRLGGYLTENGRRRISEANSGKQYRLGMKASKETIDLIRVAQLTDEAKERWQKYSRLGPVAKARKVKCLDDGKTFESASAAASNYNVARSAVIEICLGKKYRKTIGGLKFQYEAEK